MGIVITSPVQGKGAKDMDHFFGRRPARGQSIVIIINKLICLRIQIPYKIAQPQSTLPHLRREHFQKEKQIGNLFLRHNINVQSFIFC